MDRERWNERYRGSERLWSAEPNRFAREECADLGPGRALDLATGEGRNALWLASLGWRVTAVDFSDAGVERGRRFAEERGLAVDWRIEDLLDYRPAPRSFDLVLCLYLHVPPVERAVILRRAAAALVTGGTLLAVGHDVTNPEDGHGGPKDPAVLWTPEAIAAELPALEIVRAERAIREVEAEDGERARAIDTLVRARRGAE